jgi:hypothetical protein
MQGLYIKGQRPKTKKQAREAIKADPSSVHIEATSMFGNEYDGPVSELPEGQKVYFVGPDPYTKRNWYGNIVRNGEQIKVN